MEKAKQKKQRITWRITDLPRLSDKRDWRHKNEMIALIQYAFLGMDDRKQGLKMLEIGLLNGIIEQNENNLYRIKPAKEEMTAAEMPA